MPQLLVRNLESSVIKKLRHRAAVQGVSVEEAHRRLLRSALAGPASAPQGNFIAYLCSIPPGAALAFPRGKDLPRPVAL